MSVASSHHLLFATLCCTLASSVSILRESSFHMFAVESLCHHAHTTPRFSMCFSQKLLDDKCQALCFHAKSHWKEFLPCIETHPDYVAMVEANAR